MSPAVPFLLLLLLAASNKKEDRQFQVRDESTDSDILCADPSVSINFTNLRLGSIGKDFITSPMITCLELKDNYISKLDAHAFDNVPNLKYLQISFNSFDLNNAFSNVFENVEVLLLDNVPYSQNTLTINGIFPKLRKLFLRNNEIYELFVDSPEIFPSLTHLYLSGNDLINDEFGWLPESLKYLDLTSNRLRHLTLSNLINLKSIMIDKSYDRLLTFLFFKNLVNLEYLSASSNNINEITSGTFANISSLLYLDLSDNNIRHVEEGSLDSMSNLRFLNLSSNAMERFEGGVFEKLSNLKVLNLEKNLITMFPMIGHPSALESISLNCNKIKSIVGGTFLKMTLLDTLLLHNNEIKHIDQEAFAGLERLKILTLSNNQLSVLPQYWSKHLSNLEELDLTGNQFLNFGDLALSQSLTLKNIYLSNQILFIETTSLINVPVNATIYLNPSFNFVGQCDKHDINFD